MNVEVFYLHPDHLGTPRVATRSTAVGGATSGPNAINKAVWTWDSDPFGSSLGNSKPNENPQGVTGTASQITAASFRVNSRFPGQLADAESGKYYNYFRDYDSSVGRYSTSDPIGLRGGLSTFGYVGQSPAFFSDSKGLAASIGLPIYGPPVLRLCTNPAGCIGAVLGGAYLALSQCKPTPKERCERQCDRDYDVNIVSCEAFWKMHGRNKDAYRVCMARANEIYVECYQSCAKE